MRKFCNITPDDCTKAFVDEWNEQVYEVSRSWVLDHVMECDMHYGDEVPLILSMNGLPFFDL